jgi:hypothetical protein
MRELSSTKKAALIAMFSFGLVIILADTVKTYFRTELDEIKAVATLALILASLLIVRLVYLGMLGLIVSSKGLTLQTIWKLFSFCLPRPVRKTLFEPAYNDMLKQYVIAKRDYARWRFLLAIAFSILTAWTFMQCVREMIGAKTFRFLLWFFPALKTVKYLKWW